MRVWGNENDCAARPPLPRARTRAANSGEWARGGAGRGAQGQRTAGAARTRGAMGRARPRARGTRWRNRG